MSLGLLLLLVAATSEFPARGPVLGPAAQRDWEVRWDATNARREGARNNNLRRIEAERALLNYGTTIVPGTQLREWRGTLQTVDLVELPNVGELVVGQIALSDSKTGTPHVVRFAARRHELADSARARLATVETETSVYFDATVLGSALAKPEPIAAPAPAPPPPNPLKALLATVRIHFTGRPPRAQPSHERTRGEARRPAPGELFPATGDYALALSVVLTDIGNLAPRFEPYFAQLGRVNDVLDSIEARSSLFLGDGGFLSRANQPCSRAARAAEAHSAFTAVAARIGYCCPTSCSLWQPDYDVPAFRAEAESLRILVVPIASGVARFGPADLSAGITSLERRTRSAFANLRARQKDFERFIAFFSGLAEHETSRLEQQAWHGPGREAATLGNIRRRLEGRAALLRGRSQSRVDIQLWACLERMEMQAGFLKERGYDVAGDPTLDQMYTAFQARARQAGSYIPSERNTLSYSFGCLERLESAWRELGVPMPTQP